MKIGSVCSGIEAASVAWLPLGFKFEWFSEIAEYPSKVLNLKYPNIPNLGDMNFIPEGLAKKKVRSPDILCAGTPCQAFSLSGLRNGLNDERGNLTLKFVDIVNANDAIREKNGDNKTIVFWENVEGVLSDKTNAFGCMISALVGLDEAIIRDKWPTAGYLKGPNRVVAWRVLDAKYFGVPQQRKRLYLISADLKSHPENVLFEEFSGTKHCFPKNALVFEKDGHKFEVFREYTDCLYSAYGTKWNGNAPAFNGSLFVVQDGRIRRLSPLETERLMGFPDNYTYSEKCKKTCRYQATGNSWAVPVVKKIGENLKEHLYDTESIFEDKNLSDFLIENESYKLYLLDSKKVNCLNVSDIPNKPVYGNMYDIVDSNAPEDIYISPVGCYGMIRRKNERHIKMNKRLEEVLIDNSKSMNSEEIEEKSRRQKRGRFSN